MGRAWGKIGSAKKRIQGWGQKNGERPPALPGHGDDGRHVKAVEVGAFFAVNLDVDESAVHQGSGFGVFEGFVGHDMTPVAGGITDAEKDGLIFTPGFFKRFVSPRIPVNRVGGMLEQIRRSGCGKMVGHAFIITCFI